MKNRSIERSFYQLFGLITICFCCMGPCLADEAIVLNPQVDWRTGTGTGPLTTDWGLNELPGGGQRFMVNEPGHAAVFNWPINLHVDPQFTPIMKMTYRAMDVKPKNPNEALLTFYYLDRKTLTVFRYKDMQVDGLSHTMQVDLRLLFKQQKISYQPLNRFDLRVFAAADGPGTFDLIDLRFEMVPGLPQIHNNTPAPEPKRVLVEVIDEKNQPIEHATVTLDPHLRGGTSCGFTDASGKLALPTPAFGLAGIRQSLRVEAKGRYGLTFHDLSDVDEQTSLKAQLFPARTFSGKVIDEQKQPVAHATGELWLNGLPEPLGLGRPYYPYHPRIIADEQGCWITPPMPVFDNLSLQIRWRQQGYLQDRWGGQYSGQLPMSAFEEGSAVSILKRGIALTGTVYGTDDKPVANALVAQGKDRFGSNEPPSTRTDKEGHYRFEHTPEGELVLTVKAGQYAPQLVQLNPTPDMPPVDFHLKDAAKFHFLIVDKDLNAVADAMICPDTWKGFRTIPGPIRTDKEGVATWLGPPDPVEFDFIAKGKITKRDLTFSPSKDEDDIHIVYLNNPLQIKVNVTDAVTGKPIERFEVINGFQFRKEDKPHFGRRNRDIGHGKDGKWEGKITEHYPFRVVRIEVPGYAPVESQVIALDAGEVALDFALKPAANWVGTVWNVDQKPLAGASVYVCTGPYRPFVQNGKIQNFNRGPILQTDPKGQFTSQPMEPDTMLLVLDDTGYAYATVTQLESVQNTLTLQSWAKITGKVMVGNQPGAGETLVTTVISDSPQAVHFMNQQTADQQGNFTFERVVAVFPSSPDIPQVRTIEVAREIKYSERTHGMANGRKVQVEPGKTSVVQIGGTGRPIIGRIAWPKDAVQKPLMMGHRSLVSLSEARKFYNAGLPDQFDQLDAQQRKAFMESDAGKQLIAEYRKRMAAESPVRVSHGFAIAPDGMFRIEDVEPGAYTLSIAVTDEKPYGRSGWGQQIGRYTQELIVSPLASGMTYDPTPMDLGTLSLEVIKPRDKKEQQ